MKCFNFLALGRTLLMSAAVVAMAVGAAMAEETWDCGDPSSEGGAESVKATLDDDGTLTISGTGRMKDYSSDIPFSNWTMYGEAPWIGYTGSLSGDDGIQLRIKSIVVKDGVTKIGSRTCAGCRNLTSVTIPSSVDTINGAFIGCTALTSVTIPNSVKYLDDFSGCTGIKSITIPNSVKYLGGFDNTALTSITIPSSVDTIGYRTFAGCTGLTSVIIPNSVNFIGSNAFDSCTGLTSIIIPNSVEALQGFNSCTALTSVVIGDGVKYIDYNFLKNCPALKSLAIGNGVKNLTHFPLYEFLELDTLVVGTGLTSIQKEIFNPYKTYVPNTVLTYVSIGGGAIKDSAFLGFSKLTTLILGDSVKSIGKSAFASCSSLTSVTIPSNVDSISTGAFSGCAALKFAAIGSGKIGAGAFADLTNLTTLILGGKVKSIGESAFSGCTKLMTLTVPDNVASIGASAFSGCLRLQTAAIGNGTDTVGGSAFKNCAGLTSVIIGSKVKSIGASAFDGCTGLTSLTSLASDPPIVNAANTFNGIDKAACKLKVQQIDMGMYRAADGWKDFTIEAVTFPNVPVTDITGVPASFKLGQTLTLTGTVVPATATNKAIVWSVAGASISGTNFTGAVIEDGNKLSAASPGTVVVRAAIANGAITGEDFERYFFIMTGADGEEVTSVLSWERVVPQVKSAEAVSVSPVARVLAGIAAGPNPAVRSSGAINFFRSGAVVKSAELSVCDASGSIVNKIRVTDGASGGQSRRKVGSWDLRDGNGRLVSEGTYLIRGAVKTRDGKTERVSLVVGVK